MKKNLGRIACDLISKTFPHLFPSLENILTIDASDTEVRIQNPVKEVVFKIISSSQNLESIELNLQAENPDGGEPLEIKVEVMNDKTLNYLTEPPIKSLVTIFDRSC